MIDASDVMDTLNTVISDEVQDNGNITKSELDSIGLEFNKALQELKERAENPEKPEEVDEEDDEFEDADPDAEDEISETEDKPKE